MREHPLLYASHIAFVANVHAQAGTLVAGRGRAFRQRIVSQRNGTQGFIILHMFSLIQQPIRPTRVADTLPPG